MATLPVNVAESLESVADIDPVINGSAISDIAWSDNGLNPSIYYSCSKDAFSFVIKASLPTASWSNEN